MARKQFLKNASGEVIARITKAIGLVKPLKSDYYNIDVHNGNMDKIETEFININNIKANKDTVDNIISELNESENTKYSTVNGVKEFTCKNGYIDNIHIQGLTKILNANNVEVQPGTAGARLVSVGQGDRIDVLTRNKNIIPHAFEYGIINSVNGSVVYPQATNRFRQLDYTFVKKGVNYISNMEVNFNFFDLNKKLVSSIYSFTFTPNQDGYIRIHSVCNDMQDLSTIRLQIEDGTVSTSYVTPKYDKKQISTTLRSLQNGVKDEIVQQGNRYYKIVRCGEITLNGGEAWEYDSAMSGNGFYAFIMRNFNVGQTNENNYCDKFRKKANWNTLEEGIWVDSNLCLTVPSSKASNTTELKSWLQNNNVTVVHELATPQIIEIPNPNTRTLEDKTTFLLNTGAIQGEANFDVTNSLGSALDVIASKLSDLDDFVDVKDVYYPSLLNGWINDSDFSSLRLSKNGKTVTICGVIKNGTLSNGTRIFGNFPTSYAPKTSMVIPIENRNKSTGLVEFNGIIAIGGQGGLIWQSTKNESVIINGSYIVD